MMLRDHAVTLSVDAGRGKSVDKEVSVRCSTVVFEVKELGHYCCSLVLGYQKDSSDAITSVRYRTSIGTHPVKNAKFEFVLMNGAETWLIGRVIDEHYAGEEVFQ